MLGDMIYWKVLDYSQNNARVYYVSSGFTDGDILCFTKENGEWRGIQYGQHQEVLIIRSGRIGGIFFIRTHD
jgi:hypothetical protein